MSSNDNMPPMLTRQSEEGVGHTVVELPDSRHVYITAWPRGGGNLAAQTRDSLGALGEVMRLHNLSGQMVAQSVFVADTGEVDECRRLVAEFYGDAMPATTYVAQPPCQDKLVAIEALGVSPRAESVPIRRLASNLVVAHYDGTAWCHLGGVGSNGRNGSLHAETLDAFAETDRLLRQAGFRFSQIIRTWLYLGDIIGHEGPLQRYQELNRARDDFYAGVRFEDRHTSNGDAGRGFYPASTGIGAAGDRVAMSCVAVSGGRDGQLIVPLENPHQVSAFEYGPDHGPSSPRFSRAVAVVGPRAVTVFVSGTASITGSESRHADDVAKQTHQTLDNIEALIAAENLDRHGVAGTGATLADVAQLRVYLKRPDDYALVAAICRERVGDAPAVYAVADVCREELLVEIEAVAVAARST